MTRQSFFLIRWSNLGFFFIEENNYPAEFLSQINETKLNGFMAPLNGCRVQVDICEINQFKIQKATTIESVCID